MNDDLISRAAAIDAAESAYIKGVFPTAYIREVPSAQPERKKGKWIMLDKGLIVTAYKCSECGRTVRDVTGYDVSNDYPFCHCGADMMEEDA